MQSYLNPIKMPTPEAVKIPMRISKGKNAGIHELDHHYLPPHKLISFLYHNFRYEFDTKLLGSTGAIAEFWNGISQNDPRIVKLKADHPNYKSCCIPIVIHGDGVPCTNNHTLDTISFESLLAKRSVDTCCSTLDYIFYISGAYTDND